MEEFLQAMNAPVNIERSQERFFLAGSIYSLVYADDPKVRLHVLVRHA